MEDSCKYDDLNEPKSQGHSKRHGELPEGMSGVFINVEEGQAEAGRGETGCNRCSKREWLAGHAEDL